MAGRPPASPRRTNKHYLRLRPLGDPLVVAAGAPPPRAGEHGPRAPGDDGRRREAPRLSPLSAGVGQSGAYKVEGRAHSAQTYLAVAVPGPDPSRERAPGDRQGAGGGRGVEQAGGSEWEVGAEGEAGPSVRY